MNMFVLLADFIHATGILTLLLKIWTTKNCAGISAKTQFLLTIVFAARYLDLTVVYYSAYNTIFKILYITLTCSTTLSMYTLFYKTYSRQHDTFRIELLILPAAIAALFINHNFDTLEIFWTFSIYLEAVAILPQTHLVSKANKVERVVVMYVCSLALYRSLYVMNWMYRYNNEGNYDKIMIAAGLVQVVFYCDFFARILPRPKEFPQIVPERHVAVVELNDNIAEKSNAEKATNSYINNIHTVVLTPAFLTTDPVAQLPSYEKATENDVQKV